MRYIIRHTLDVTISSGVTLVVVVVKDESTI